MFKRSVFFQVVLAAVLLLPDQFVFAQGEANIWYFGQQAGLDFNGGAPVPVTNGQMFIDEGCGSISDASGNLLFYTNGIMVWNKNHAQMPNGSGLMGNMSAAQSGLIIQRPGSTNIYYIFTATDQANPGGIRYTEVDMTLNGGLGDVTANKNVLLMNPSCEKITGIRHCNNKDVWVVTHDWGSNTFRTYLVTAAGISATPVVSSSGLVNTGGTGNMNAIGCLKGSPDGKKLASSIQDDNRFELFDFNNSTGVVSNGLAFPVIPGTTYAYGVEFSPDGSRLYLSCPTPGNIYQYDLCAGSSAAILSSRVLIGSSTNFIGSLQLGPDKKIYLAQWTSTFIGVISSPNTLGTGCNYTNGVGLAGKTSMVGLPQSVPYYFPPSFQSSDTCLIATFVAPTYTINSCSGPANGITSVSWNFGDPASGSGNTATISAPAHTFTSAGTYTVSLVVNTACGSDTIKQSVTVTSCVFSATINSVDPTCNGQCTGMATANATSGVTPYTYSWSNGQTTSAVTGLCAGNYSVTITDGVPSTVTATVAITQPVALTASTTVVGASCGSNNGSATVSAGGGTPGYTYAWAISPVQTASTATGLTAGNYTVTVTDASGCSIVQTALVTSGSVLNLTATSTQTGCSVNSGTASVISSNGTIPFTYAWSSGQTTSAVTGLVAGTYSVLVTDAGGCSQTQTVSIAQTPGVPATVSANPASISAGDSTALVASVGGTYLWIPATGLSCITCQNPSATPSVTTIYCVTVTDTNGCIDSACVTVVVTIEPVDCSKAGELFLPNAFSPNNDLENDILQIHFGDLACIETFSITIYDRWGVKVFESDDPAFQWNGTYKGKEQNSGVFAYYLESMLINGESVNRKGNLSLIR